MKVGIVVKQINDTYEDFEMKVSKETYAKRMDGYTIQDVNVLFDSKRIIAIIKYI
jgi:hypothetical protein